MNLVTRIRGGVVLASVLAPAVFAVSAFADPLVGERIKFDQQPLSSPNVIGHDQFSTAFAQTNANGVLTGYTGTFVADDFADKFSTPVVHLSWWGSYQNNVLGPTNGVKRFLISFESDVPTAPTGLFSHPGTPLLSQIVTLGPLSPASGTFTETNVTPAGVTGDSLYKYNGELKVPFPEQANTVYWLKIVALSDAAASTAPGYLWGWHDRDYNTTDALASTAPAVSPGEVNLGTATAPVWHFQDDAVNGNVVLSFIPGTTNLFTVDQSGYQPLNYIDGVDGPTGISRFSQDQAFQLYTTVPEPATVLGIGMLTLTALARRTGRRVG